jgi:hemolysin activation/secretion protein
MTLKAELPNWEAVKMRNRLIVFNGPLHQAFYIFLTAAALAFLTAAALAFWLLPSSAMAQGRPPIPPGVPNSGTITRETEAMRSRSNPGRQNMEFPQIPPVVSQDGGGSGPFLVQDFKINFISVPGVREQDVQNALAPYKGRQLTRSQLEEAAAKVTEIYRSKGYLMSQTAIVQTPAGGGIVLLQLMVNR